MAKKSNAHLDIGNAYYKSEKYQEAIESYKQALRIDPNDIEAHNNLGATYGNSGKYEEAIESFKQAIRIDPDYAEALLISAFSISFRGQKFHPACKLLVS